MRIGKCRCLVSQIQSIRAEQLLGVETGPSYDIAQIDRFLTHIDESVIDGLGFTQMGPFAVFHGTSKEVLAQDSPHHLTSLDEFQEDEEEDVYFAESGSKSVDSGSSAHLSPEEEILVSTESDIPEYQLTQPPLIHGISFTVLGDPARDNLMNHYIVNIASLLQPIQHPHNPYRNLYVPAALQAAPCFASGTEIPPESVQSVLLHSLLASASFHIWNCNMENATYHKIGMQHRHKAISQLQSVLSSSVPGTEYKTLMMAILSLVTIDVSSKV